MSAAPLDLSAGIVPAAPQTQASAPLDLSAGIVPAQGSAGPVTQTDGLWNSVKQGAKDVLMDPVTGVAKGAVGTVAGLAQMGHDLGEAIHPGLGEYGASQSSINAAQRFAQPTDTAQSIGKGIEGVAEFMGGEGVLKKGVQGVAEYLMGKEAEKGATIAEQLKAVRSIIPQLEKSPTLLRIAQNTIATAQKAGEVIGSHPNASAIAGTALRQGIVGGTQAAVHGSDENDVGMEAGIGAVGGALGEGVGAIYNAVKPGVAEIAGQTIPKLASQSRGIARRIIGADIDEAPKIAAAQQVGAQAGLENIAQNATRRTLEDLNATRMPIQAMQDPARMLGASDEMQPYRFDLPLAQPEMTDAEGMLYPGQTQQIGGMQYTQGADGEMVQNPSMRVPRSVEEPGTYQGLTGIEPGSEPPDLGDPTVSRGGLLQTADPAAAQQHLTAMNEALEGNPDPELAAGRDQLQQQLDWYHAAQNAGPKFAPIDTQAAAARVSSFKDASDQIQASARPVYQKLDEVSGGEFNKWRAQQRGAERDITKGTTADAINAAQDRYAEATGKIDDIFKSYQGRAGVKPADYNAAQKAWAASKTLDQVHATVEGMFNGVPKDVAQRIAKQYGPGEVQRELTRASTERVGQLVDRVGMGKLQATIGADGVDNLYRIADLMSDSKRAAQTHTLASHVGKLAALHGVHAGAGAVLGYTAADLSGGDYTERRRAAEIGAATQGLGSLALRQMAINPRIGQLMDYAVRNNVNPKLAIPLITGSFAQLGR